MIKKDVVIVGKAVSDKNKIETMYINAPGAAFNTLSPKWVNILRVDHNRYKEQFDFKRQQMVETITLENIIETYGTPFFIKIDVEGYEPNVLRGLKRPIQFISFEVNLPEFQPEGIECINLLSRIDPLGKFNFTVNNPPELILDHWVDEKEFILIYKECKENSIEVFWKSSI